MKLATAFASGSILTAMLLGSGPASAQDIGPDTSRKVLKSTKELGLDNLLMMQMESGKNPQKPDTELTQTDLFFFAGPVFRYFVADNIALGLNVNFFYGLKNESAKVTDPQTTESTTTDHKFTDAGALGFLMANYYVPLTGGLFFKPGIGGGGFYGSRTSPHPTDPNLQVKTQLTGGAGRLDLGFAFFPSRKVNIRAGIDGIYRMGSAKPATEDTAPATTPPTGAPTAGTSTTPETQSFTKLDIGVSAGVGLIF